MKRSQTNWLWHVALVFVLICGILSCVSVSTEDIPPPCSISVPNSISNSELHPVEDPESDRWGFIDATGHFRIEPQFYSVTEFNEGLAIAKTESGWGILDTQGNWHVPPQLELNSARSFCNGLAAVETEHWGFIDVTGEFVISPQYEWVSDFSEGRAWVKSDRVNPAFAVHGPYDLIDQQGHHIAQLTHYDVDPVAPNLEFSHGRLGVRGAPDPRFVNLADVVERRIYWGFIDRRGRLTLPVQFKSVQPFSEGLAAITTQQNMAGFIDPSGRIVIEPRFDDTFPFSEGLATVKVDNQWGYINKTGEIVIPPQFGVADRFSEGVASVKIGEKWGFINQKGEVMIAPQFEFASSFHGGLAQVEVDDQNGYINHDGKVVWSLVR